MQCASLSQPYPPHPPPEHTLNHSYTYIDVLAMSMATLELYINKTVNGYLNFLYYRILLLQTIEKSFIKMEGKQQYNSINVKKILSNEEEYETFLKITLN